MRPAGLPGEFLGNSHSVGVRIVGANNGGACLVGGVDGQLQSRAALLGIGEFDCWELWIRCDLVKKKSRIPKTQTAYLFDNGNEVFKSKKSENLLCCKGSNAVHGGVHKRYLAFLVFLSKRLVLYTIDPFELTR